MDYDREDKIALKRALLGMKLCPRCRQDLLPVGYAEDIWGCSGKAYPLHSPETWHLPQMEG